MIEGVDGLSHADPAALVAAGKHFVCAYLKNTYKATVDAYHAAGLSVVLIYETTGSRALGGYDSGLADAVNAKYLASQLGAPADLPIYFAEDDLDVQTGAQAAACVAYARGLAQVLGPWRVGWYGGATALKAVLDSGYAAYGWETYAWNGGTWDPRAQMQQYLNGQVIGGHGVDLDRAMVASYGAWLPPVAPKPAPGPQVMPATDNPDIVRYRAPGYPDAWYTLAPEVGPDGALHLVLRWIETEARRQWWFRQGARSTIRPASDLAMLPVMLYPPPSL